MTKSKSSALSILIPSIFVMHVVNVAPFLNAICVAPAFVTVISPITKV